MPKGAYHQDDFEKKCLGYNQYEEEAHYNDGWMDGWIRISTLKMVKKNRMRQEYWSIYIHPLTDINQLITTNKRMLL